MPVFLRTLALLACAVAIAPWGANQALAGAPPPPPINPASGTNSASASSWVAGAHAGYTWQQGGAVFGFETDLQGMNLNSSMNDRLNYPFLPPPVGDIARTSSSIDWYGTLRGQIGFANGPIMFYATGGLAYGRVSLSSLFSTAGITLNQSTSDTKAGWVGGVGVNYLVQPNVVLNLQYQYVDLGSISLAGTSPLGPVVITQRANASGQFQTVMAGISWRFAPSGSAPWQGGYAGVHGGGAWGNNADATYGSTVFLSDARLKRDVTLLARRGDGLGVYAYKYLWSDDVHVGVMAQEVALIHPAAIVRDELTGYMAVDYGLLNAH